MFIDPLDAASYMSLDPIIRNVVVKDSQPQRNSKGKIIAKHWCQWKSTYEKRLKADVIGWMFHFVYLFLLCTSIDLQGGMGLHSKYRMG